MLLVMISGDDDPYHINRGGLCWKINLIVSHMKNGSTNHINLEGTCISGEFLYVRVMSIKKISYLIY